MPNVPVRARAGTGFGGAPRRDAVRPVVGAPAGVPEAEAPVTLCAAADRILVASFPFGARMNHRPSADTCRAKPTAFAPSAPDGGADGVTGAAAATRAFEQLTMPYLADVARFARSLARDAAGADDLVQETYLQALRGWHTFHAGANPKRWLLTICHHAFLRTAHRDGRYVEVPGDDPELESLATAVAHARAQRSGAADAVERLDLGAAIGRALAEVPAHYRAAVVLVDVEGQAYEEAALVLGVAVGTVRSRLFRARRLLQDLLFDHARDAGFGAARADAGTAASPSRR